MDQASLVEIGLPAALFLIMVGMGLTLTPKDFREVLIAPRATVYGLVAQIVLLPLVGVGLAMTLDLSPTLAVGLVIIAACPGGTTSNLFAFLGRGDVALSIVLTVAASLVTVVTLPMFTSWALGHFRDSDLVLELPVLRTILTLVVIILVPVSIGMTIRHFRQDWAVKGEKLVSVFGLLVLVAVIVMLLVDLGGEALVLLRQGGAAVILLNLIGLGLGLFGGRLIGLSRPQAFTVAIELGIKNGTLGLMVTLTLLQSDAMSVPAAVYGVMMFLFGFLMIGYARLTGIGRAPVTS
ncbi:putative sodium/bile acid transporter family protein [Alcanivorax venustensis ISO4]|uniref:Sodium/bile acid transporter family protein n=1 Tax=Alloalcanivorax venustensis ISO4 TaxID=1177184 RepID=A0ABS0ACF2_9GAMM|nr:bile acid:sodium symporter family protein [Alloalcanivorax venustensis]MBF5051785.1 putative sodium/bile acid transporter family protein [Alloalcanivorax venustensis ISO4]